MMSGGVVPGGNCRSCVWDMAVTCADRRGDIGAGLEENLDDGDAVQRLGFDVLDVIQTVG